MTDYTATGSFHVTDGKIIDPNGSVFVARGVNVLEGNQPSVSTLEANFPGLNFVRLAIYDYANPSDLASYVDSLTSKGIVVELEDHTNSTGSNAGGSQGTIYTGQQLTTELDWYSSVASAFKDNAYVWFGTNNEPSEIDSSGNFDAAALSTWQKETYDAIRNAGNTNPILLEANSWGVDGTNIGYTASDYASMTNVVWDIHYYGWVSGYSTNQSTVSSTLSGIAAAAQEITSADGTIPVIIGEYGNSTDGQTLDANASEVITAVQDSGYGSAAWAYLNANADGLIDAGGSLSSFGKEIASSIASAAANALSVSTTSAAVAASSSSSASSTESGNGSVLLAGSTSSLTDASGNTWTIGSDGTVYENGAAAGYTANVIELAYVDGVIWHENSSDLWWSWTGTGWLTEDTSPLA